MFITLDMAVHFSSLAKFKANVNDALGLADETAEGRAGTMKTLMADYDIRVMVMQMCIKSSDIANAAKPWEIHEQVRAPTAHSLAIATLHPHSASRGPCHL